MIFLYYNFIFKSQSSQNVKCYSFYQNVLRFSRLNYACIWKIQMQLWLSIEIPTCKNWILEHFSELRNNTEVYE